MDCSAWRKRAGGMGKIKGERGASLSSKVHKFRNKMAGRMAELGAYRFLFCCFWGSPPTCMQTAKEGAQKKWKCCPLNLALQFGLVCSEKHPSLARLFILCLSCGRRACLRIALLIMYASVCGFGFECFDRLTIKKKSLPRISLKWHHHHFCWNWARNAHQVTGLDKITLEIVWRDIWIFFKSWWFRR